MKKPVVTAFRRALIKSEITFGRENRMNTRQSKSLIINFLLPNQKKRATNRALNEQPHHVCRSFDGFNEHYKIKSKKKDLNPSVHTHSVGIDSRVKYLRRPIYSSRLR